MHLEDLNLHNSILLNTKINKDYIIDNDASETKKGTYFVSSLAMTSSLTEYGISSIFTLFLILVKVMHVAAKNNKFWSTSCFEVKSSI